MAQQTAVEQLESKFQKFLLYYEGNHKAEPYTIQELSSDFEQAKQMENEQKEEEYKRGWEESKSTAIKYVEEFTTRLQNETN